MNEKIFDCTLNLIKEDDHPFIQYKVLLILESLLEEKSKLHQTFLNKADLKHFLSLLGSPDSFLKKHALIVIHFIVNTSSESHTILSYFGLVNYLIRISQTKDENFSLVITTLGNMLGTNLVDKSYVKEGLPLLCRALYDDDTKGQALGFLRRIITKPDREYIDILLKSKIIPLLTRLFLFRAKASPLQLSHVVKIMGNIFSDSEESILTFLETPQTLDRVNDLLESDLELKRRLGLWLLLRIINHQSLDYLFISPEILVTVFRISQNSSWKMQKNASFVFVKIIKVSSEEHMGFMMEKYGPSVVYSIQPLLDITFPELEEQDVIEALKAVKKVIEFSEASKLKLSNSFFLEINEIMKPLNSLKNQEISLLDQEITQKALDLREEPKN